MQRDRIYHRDPDILGGTPVFTGTRVPIDTLLAYLRHGKRIDDFRDGFSYGLTRAGRGAAASGRARAARSRMKRVLLDENLPRELKCALVPWTSRRSSRRR